MVGQRPPRPTPPRPRCPGAVPEGIGALGCRTEQLKDGRLGALLLLRRVRRPVVVDVPKVVLLQVPQDRGHV
jgi:hypothetical protein